MKHTSILTILFIFLAVSTASALEIPKTVGHRGFSAIAPENTCASIRKAWEAGAGGSECDVYITTDGVVCLMHDGTTKRTSEGKVDLPMRDSSWDQLKDVCVPNGKPGYENEKIPTLAQALETHKQCPGCYPVIEIKDAKAAMGVLDELKKADMLDKAFIISFSYEAVQTVCANSKVPTAYLAGKLETPEDVRNFCRKTKAAGAGLIDIMYFDGMTEEHIKAAHDEGVVCWIWTVNDLKVMRKLISWGVDSVTTDRPDLMRLALSSPSEETCEWTGAAQSSDFTDAMNFAPKKTASILLGTKDHLAAKARLSGSDLLLESLTLGADADSQGELSVVLAKKAQIFGVQIGKEGAGSLSLGLGTVLNSSSVILGEAPNSAGTLTLKDADLTTISLSIGDAEGSKGTLKIEGKSHVNVLGALGFGHSGESFGEQTGGEVVACANLLFGESGKGSTEYALKDGLFWTKRGFSLGSAGKGLLEISGGEFRADGQFVIGFYSANSTVRQTGGTANIGGTQSAWGYRTNPGFIEGFSKEKIADYCAGIQFGGTRMDSEELRTGGTGEYYLEGGTVNTPRISNMTRNLTPMFFLSGGELNVLSDPAIPYSGLVAAPIQMKGGTLRAETILAKGYMADDSFVQEGGVFEPVGKAKIDGNYVVKNAQIVVKPGVTLDVTGNFECENATITLPAGADLNAVFPGTKPTGKFEIK
ncbi:MAG: hypothetical protein IJU53_08245 [Thermoguttaceae bacterium]|nr:hypothetical protein [Thermoguttaceae bacterium]